MRCHVTFMCRWLRHGDSETVGHDEKLRSKPNDCAELGFLNLKDDASRSYIIQVILAIDPASLVHQAQPLTRLM